MRNLKLAALALVCLALLVAACILWRARPIEDRLVHAGDAVIAIEGRPYWDFPWGLRAEAGVGFEGTVVVTADGCVAIRQENFKGGYTDVMAVWPRGTSLVGSGHAVEIIVGPQRVHIGDSVVGGSGMRSNFPSIEGQLPPKCGHLPITDFDPGS
jgi:hypothetical protein